MGRPRRLHVFLCFIFVARFLPSSSELDKYCWEADRDAGLCCTCTDQPHTLRCGDTCPPNYYLAEVSVPCLAADDDVRITSEPPSSVSVDNHSVTTDVQADLQAPYNVCVLCDEACSGCTGSGPAKCIFCAKEYNWTDNPLFRGKCIMNAESSTTGLNSGLILGVSVGGVVLIVIVLVALLLCRLRQRRLHKRDPLEPALQLDDIASHCAARKDMMEEENALAVTSKNTMHVSGIVHETQWTQSAEQGPEMSDRYISDPTATLRNPRQVEKIQEESENTTKLYESMYIPTKFLNQFDESGSSYHNIQTDGEGGYVNATFNAACSSLRNSVTRGSQELYESSVNNNIDGATKGPNKGQNKKEAMQARDSGIGSSVSIDSDVDRSSSPPYQNFVFGNPSSKIPAFSMSWHFCKSFSADGGVLQRPKSDVYLSIPKGAVLGGTNITIYGAVSTDLPRVHTYLSLSENESIASPVVEYCASLSKFESQEPMCITLPHFINPPVSHEFMKVYCFRRRKSSAGFHLERLRFVEKGDLKQAVAYKDFKSSAGVYNFDNKAIYIWTAHFSGYLCTYCGDIFTPPVIQTEVLTKYTSASRQMEIRLNVWDSRFNINDFKENRPDKDTVSLTGMVLIDVKPLLALKVDEDVTSIALGTRLTLGEEDEQMWVHKQIRGEPVFPPESAKIRVIELVPCKCTQFPLRVDWLLTKAVTNAGAASVAGDDDDNARPLECMVEVGYVKCSEDEDAPTPLRFLRRPNPVRIPVSVKPVESATVANVSGPPMVNIERADLVSFSASSTGDQTHRLRQKPRNPAPRASSHVYQNLGFPIPDSRDMGQENP